MSNEIIILDQIINAKHKELSKHSTIGKFFEFFTASEILKDFDLSYEEIETGICGKGDDGGIDSCFLFLNGKLVQEDFLEDKADFKETLGKEITIELVFIQSKFTEGFKENSFKSAMIALNQLLDFTENLIRLKPLYNEKIINFFELFKSIYMDLVARFPKVKINYFYVTKGMEIHPKLKELERSLKDDLQKKIPNSENSVRFVKASELLNIVRKPKEQIFKLSLAENPMSTSDQVFITLVNIYDYYKFIIDTEGNIRRNIFESNVRDHEGINTINSEISATLSNNEIDDFWWLNNGITILGSKANAPGGKTLIIENPEIVNGLQTSYEIYNYFNENKNSSDKRNVLVRIIVPLSSDTRDRIIKATNSQTQIPKALLRATDKIHRDIEDFFKPFDLYYDRRKNFYKNSGIEPSKIISLPLLSQSLISIIMQKPNMARKRPSTLLTDDDTYKTLFNPETPMIVYLNAAKIIKTIESTLRISDEINNDYINDLKFYVVLDMVVKITKNQKPGTLSLKEFPLSALTETSIIQSYNFVKDLYEQLGANNKVVKEPALLDILQKRHAEILK